MEGTGRKLKIPEDVEFPDGTTMWDRNWIVRYFDPKAPPRRWGLVSWSDAEARHHADSLQADPKRGV